MKTSTRSRTRILTVALIAVVAMLASACETTMNDQDHMTARANETRRSVGVAALAIDKHMHNGADMWARTLRDDWVNRGCKDHKAVLRHTSSLVGHYAPQHAMANWRTIGENVGVVAVNGNNRAAAMNSLHQAYLNSPDHRANIVNGRFTRTGQGIVYGPTVDQLAAGKCPGVQANSMLWSTAVFIG